MAYGVKYRFRFYDVFDKKQILDILKKDYTGAITTLDRMGPNPISIMQQGSNDKMQTIIGKEAILEFVSETSLEWKEFAEGNNREYQVRLYVGGSGAEVLTNGSFVNWNSAGNVPDDFTVVPGDGAVNEVGSGQASTGVGTGAMNLTTTGPGEVYAYQTALTSGYYYDVEIVSSYFATADSFFCRFMLGTTYTTIPTSNDTHKWSMKADGIQFRIEGTDDIDETGGEQTFDSVSIIELGELVWIGYMNPEEHSEPFLPGNQIVQIKATDGLGDLKYEAYGSDWDTPYTGQNDLMEELAVVLGKLDFDIDIWSFVNLFNSLHNTTDSDDPLAQSYFNKERFQESIAKSGNCYDALEGMLNSFGACIKQDEGVWKIMPIRWMKKSEQELVDNGNFANWESNGEPSDWTVSEFGTGTVLETSVGGQCEFTTSGGGDAALITQTKLVVGKKYKITFTIVGTPLGSIFVGCSGGIIGQNFSTSGYKELTIVAINPSLIFICEGTDWVVIDNVSVVQVSKDYRVFNPSGVYQSNGSVDPYVAVTSPGDASPVAWIENTQRIQIQRGWKEFTIVDDMGYHPLIWNGTFDEEFWEDKYTPMKWTKSVDSEEWVEKEGEQCAMDAGGLTRYMEQSPLLPMYTWGGLLRLRFSANFDLASGTAYMRVVREVAGPIYYYLKNDGTWTTTPTYITSTSGSVVINCYFSVLEDLTIYIYSANIKWDSVAFDIVGATILDWRDKIVKTLTIVNSEDTYIPEDRMVKLGYGGSSGQYTQAFLGSLMRSDSMGLTNGWSHKGVSDSDDILDHLATDIKALHNGPSYKLLGTIRTEQLSFASVLQESVGGVTKYFLPSRMKYNTRLGRWEGEWFELR